MSSARRGEAAGEAVSQGEAIELIALAGPIVNPAPVIDPRITRFSEVCAETSAVFSALSHAARQIQIEPPHADKRDRRPVRQK